MPKEKPDRSILTGRTGKYRGDGGDSAAMAAVATTAVVHRVAVLVYAVGMRGRARGRHTLRAVVTMVPVVIVMRPHMARRWRTRTAHRRRTGMTHRRRAWVHKGAANREADVHTSLRPPCRGYKQQKTKS